jgi:hypothetical protein
VHDPNRPDTFEGVPYALVTQRYADKNHYSPSGRDEWEDVQLEDLEAWIDEH